MDNKELWKDIAENFGVELEEVFSLEFEGELFNSKYRFSGKGLEFWNVLEERWEQSTYEHSVLHDECKIKKKPWSPKTGEIYYCVARNAINEPTYVYSRVWAGAFGDINKLLLDNIFKTHKEAEEFIPIFEKKLEEALKERELKVE